MADQNPVETPQEEIQLTEEQLVTQQIILEKDQKIAQLEKEKASLTNRSLAVHQKNEMLMSSEDVQQKMAMLEYEDKKINMQLKRAAQFAASKAFPTATPEQCLVLMQAGEEMGLSPIVSMNLLYVVNGHINPYGDKMLGYILSKGYKVEYKDEVTNHQNKNEESKVTVRIYNETESYEETASSKDQIIIKSLVKGAASFALKNKLRFHAIRMIASFHLPHLFMGCGDNFSPDFDKWAEGETMKIKTKEGNTVVVISDEDILSRINDASDQDELDELMASHKAAITKDINLVSAFGAKKKTFES